MPIRLLPRRAKLPPPDADDDRSLLARFAATRDELAFAALVDRHGSMVLGVCRRVVRDPHLADDAFQAVFLVLARKAGRIEVGPSLANWLFAVARRVALTARRNQRRFENRNATAGKPPLGEPKFDDLLLALDEELSRLPDPLRAAVLECFVREKTQDEAAKTLGWSLSTLRRRLDQAKELLRNRLTARGATLSAGLLAGAVLGAAATAGVPPTLAQITVENATACLAGKAVAGSVTTLANGAMAMSTLAKLGIGVGLLGTIAVIGVAVAGGFQGDSPPVGKTSPIAVQLPPATAAAKPQITPNPEEPPKPVTPSTPVAPATEWVTLRGRVILSEPPEPKKIDVTADKGHCLKNGPLLDGAVVVNPKSKGLKNVVVWLRPDDDNRRVKFPQDRIHPDLLKPRSRHHVIDQPCCQFEPRILAARDGDTLEVKNSAPVAHNINFNSDSEQFNLTLQTGKSYRSATPLTAQNTPILFKCDIHPWMQGRLRVFDHPYFAITDDDGNFEIRNAPPGKWRVVYWHENGFHKGRNGLLGFPVELKGEKVEAKEIDFEFPK